MCHGWLLQPGTSILLWITCFSIPVDVTFDKIPHSKQHHDHASLEKGFYVR